QEAYAEQARKLCLLGYTDAELADFFEVSESTINKWKLDYPKFSESIKKSLPLCGNTVYGYKAPHKTGAGIGVLKILKATYDAPSVFFYVVGLTHPF
ncbi:hypothetical protein OFN66_28085, partial [Escherichia coli]|nr:hypothetical protein [Escherichia coli]